MSAEHITGKWMRELFPGEISVSYKDNAGTDRSWKWEQVDWKAKVVCDACNTTWMSNIESRHAKPVLTPLITGKLDIPIGLPEARSIALFAFKTAVVIDHAHSRSGTPFFGRTLRHQFGDAQRIPASVQMWLCGYAGNRESARFIPLQLQAQLPKSNDLHIYTCTFALGHLAVQVVALKESSNFIFSPNPGFEGLAVPFWPRLPRNYVWPGNSILRDRDEFLSFAYRWNSITLHQAI